MLDIRENEPVDRYIHLSGFYLVVPAQPPQTTTTTTTTTTTNL
jgi:hypothetical protein